MEFRTEERRKAAMAVRDALHTNVPRAGTLAQIDGWFDTFGLFAMTVNFARSFMRLPSSADDSFRDD